MSEDNDRTVAAALGRIETLLEGQHEMVSAHEKRISKLEVWFIRVTTGLVVFTFMTGSGPITLGSIVKFFAKLPQ